MFDATSQRMPQWVIHQWSNNGASTSSTSNSAEPDNFLENFTSLPSSPRHHQSIISPPVGKIPFSNRPVNPSFLVHSTHDTTIIESLEITPNRWIAVSFCFPKANNWCFKNKQPSHVFKSSTPNVKEMKIWCVCVAVFFFCSFRWLLPFRSTLDEYLNCDRLKRVEGGIFTLSVLFFLHLIRFERPCMASASVSFYK